jgi:hypothetical protein
MRAPTARIAEGKCGGDAAEMYVPMHDFIADWKRWSRAERVLAIVMALLMIALPIGLALASVGHA